MKKIAVLFSLILLCIGTNAYAKETANIPACKVTLNGQNVDSTYRQYPLLQYKDIVYFPMTFYDCRVLGVSTKWNGNTNTLEIYKENMSGAYRDYKWEWKNGRINEVTVSPFNLIVNGKEIDNKTEEYPILLFRDVTYFPLTWRFAVDEFGWEYSYDNENGLVINADNYICKILNLPDSRNTYYSYTTDVATDGKYYYYTGPGTKVYRTPVDNIGAYELIDNTDPNGYSVDGGSGLSFSMQNGTMYYNYRTGNSVGHDVHNKIHPDGTVERTNEGDHPESGVGYSSRIYDRDGFSVTSLWLGSSGRSHVYVTKDGDADKTEILLDGVIFPEKYNPDSHNDVKYEWSHINIVGNAVYMTGRNTNNEGPSSLYRYDVNNGALTKLLDNVSDFIAFEYSGTEYAVYYQNGAMHCYNLADGKAAVINERSLPLKQGTLYKGDLYLATSDGEKCIVECYRNFGTEADRAEYIYETYRGFTDIKVLDGMLVTEFFGEGDGDNSVATCIFNKPDGYFRSSDSIGHNAFIYNGILLYTPLTPNMENWIVEVNLNK